MHHSFYYFSVCSECFYYIPTLLVFQCVWKGLKSENMEILLLTPSWLIYTKAQLPNTLYSENMVHMILCN